MNIDMLGSEQNALKNKMLVDLVEGLWAQPNLYGCVTMTQCLKCGHPKAG